VIVSGAHLIHGRKVIDPGAYGEHHRSLRPPLYVKEVREGQVILCAVTAAVKSKGERGMGKWWCYPSNALGKFMLLSARSKK